MAQSVFDQIKKQNGEAFAQDIRAYHNGIFEVPKIVDIVKYAGRDAEPLMDYLMSLKDKYFLSLKKNKKTKTPKEFVSPFELLSKAGYHAEYADSLEKQNSIAPYFAPNERLCTFNDPKRYQKYHIINAVRHNVNDIRRGDFPYPEREDRYGTSVMSIQMLKKGGFISIKNRYNHRVENPDNTLKSNPDNIILGLSEALKNHFNINFVSQEESISEGYMLVGSKIMKYNHEVNGVYFGQDFYVEDGVIYELNKDTQVMMDQMIFDTKKRIFSDPSMVNDAFMKAFYEEIKGKEIRVGIDKEGQKCIFADGVLLVKIKEGQITSLCLPHTEKVGDGFLAENKTLSHLDMPKLQEVGNSFLNSNQALTHLDLPELQRVGSFFLSKNKVMTHLALPELQTVGSDFLGENEVLAHLDAPKLQSVGDNFLFVNKALTHLDFPELGWVGRCFVPENNLITHLALPKLRIVGDYFLSNNKILTHFDVPELQKVEDYFLCHNEALTHLSFPKLHTIGNRFIRDNENLAYLGVPKLQTAGHRFLECNGDLKHFNAPELINVGNAFLSGNEGLTDFNAPKLKTVGDYFLCLNKALQRFDAPNLKTADGEFLSSNEVLTYLNTPKLEKFEMTFLGEHPYRERLISEQKKPIISVSKNRGNIPVSLENRQGREERVG